jgi:catechol 2,3-dioxygenase-like lactoylglutathione lyase family enzyme
MPVAVSAVRASPISGWRINSLRRPVFDLQRSIAFYTDGLGFTVEALLPQNRVSLRLGDERIELIEGSAVRDLTHDPVQGPDVRFQHAAIVAADMRAAFTRLSRLSPRPITHAGPQRLPATSGGVEAFKFYDPDGHPLELICFPPALGHPRWRQGSRRGATTLGIDHFALSVSEVRSSAAFYKRTLGLVVGAEQINAGSEQARLDGVHRAVVEVVALAPGEPGTPHIELLGYRQPLPVTHKNPNALVAVDCLVFERSAANPEDALQSAEACRDPDGHVFECQVFSHHH